MNETQNDNWDDDPFADDYQAPGVAAPRTTSQGADDSVAAGQTDIGETAPDEDDELVQQLLPPERQHFTIRDASDASWVVRKIVEARARRERIKDWAKAELVAAEREEKFFLQRFGDELESWLQENSEGRKTVRLPDGTLGFRKKRPTIQIEDEERVLDWCESHLPDAIRTKRSVLKTPLNEHLQETGELPPGCDLDAGGDEFYVR
jgi:phage host-nuclease inhibitor protein Gam